MADSEVDHKPNAADDDPAPIDGPSSETEEMLPLYTESHVQREADGSIKFPDAKATPDEVRDFIVKLLTTKRNLHIDHARRVAAKWTMGNGGELRAYPPMKSKTWKILSAAIGLFFSFGLSIAGHAIIEAFSDAEDAIEARLRASHPKSEERRAS
ncbi:hypothetical protein MBLNU230_g4308t1 [Neophaeotheca triangularis]